MLVDDKYDVLQGIANGVNWNEIGDIKLFFASSGIEALEIIEHQAIQLLITDIEMPGISGLDLAEKLHREKKRYCDGFFSQAMTHFGMRRPRSALAAAIIFFSLWTMRNCRKQSFALSITD